jgi:hypothetical protein
MKGDYSETRETNKDEGGRKRKKGCGSEKQGNGSEAEGSKFGGIVHDHLKMTYVACNYLYTKPPNKLS